MAYRDFTRILFLVYIFCTLVPDAADAVAWNNISVNEGTCGPMPAHIPINTTWIGESFEAGWFTPIGSHSYFFEYSKLLKGTPLEDTLRVNDMCLQVTNTGFTRKEVPGSQFGIYNGGFFDTLHTRFNPTKYFLSGFVLIHNGFGRKLLEDCSVGAVGQKNCKVTDNTNAHTIQYSISFTDNHTYAVVVKCLTHLNQRAWVLMSTTENITTDTREKVLAHVQDELGFTGTYVLDTHYKNCMTDRTGRLIRRNPVNAEPVDRITNPEEEDPEPVDAPGKYITKAPVTRGTTKKPQTFYQMATSGGSILG